MLLTPAQIKPKSFQTGRNFFFLFFFKPGMDASHVYVRAWILCCLHSHISTQTFRRALTASLDSCAEIKSALSVAYPNLAEFGGRCRKAILEVWISTQTFRKLLTASVDSYADTIRAPRSGTFLQTLPDLVTPLKGHSLSPRSCPATRSAPSEKFGY